MADAVVARIVDQGPSELTLRLNCISDGTGESAVVKLDKSTLTGPDGVTEPIALDIKWIRWNIQGFTSVRLLWDHATDSVAYPLAGSGYDEPAYMTDPLTADQTGDLILTSAGAVSGATYDITIRLRKRGA